MRTAAAEGTTQHLFALAPNMINQWSNFLQSVIQHDWLPKHNKTKNSLASSLPKFFFSMSNKDAFGKCIRVKVSVFGWKCSKVKVKSTQVKIVKKCAVKKSQIGVMTTETPERRSGTVEMTYCSCDLFSASVSSALTTTTYKKWVEFLFLIKPH